jgi:hypothetical protein
LGTAATSGNDAPYVEAEAVNKNAVKISEVFTAKDF